MARKKATNGTLPLPDRKKMTIRQKLTIIRFVQDEESEVVGQNLKYIRNLLVAQYPELNPFLEGEKYNNLRSLLDDYQEVWELDLELPVRVSKKAELEEARAEIHRLREALASFTG